MIGRKRNNRKGIIKILEAFLAVLIVMGGVLFIMARQQTVPDIGDDVYERQRQVLDIIVNDDNLRDEIINVGGEDNTDVNNAIIGLVPPIWNFSTNVCGLNDICPNPADIYDRNVYSTEVVVSSTLDTYAPKKLRFFVWMKS